MTLLSVLVFELCQNSYFFLNVIKKKKKKDQLCKEIQYLILLNTFNFLWKMQCHVFALHNFLMFPKPYLLGTV